MEIIRILQFWFTMTKMSTSPGVLKYTDDDVVMGNWRYPRGYDLEEVCKKITHGDGWVVLKGMFSNSDIEMAKERIFKHKFGETNGFVNRDDRHNNYTGLTWGLLSRGKIFAKIATHPIILEVGRRLLGTRCRLSSLAANTVVPGMDGQGPHLDYPYYRHLWPQREGCMDLPANHLLALQVVTLITDFTPDNGATAIVPGSHIHPRHPDNQEEFFKKAVQVSAQAGDVILFAGPIQHCAMPNKTSMIRSGILQHMVPLFVTPFEKISGNGLEESNKDIRSLLATDHPHPMVKFFKNDADH